MHIDVVPNRNSRPAYLLRESYRIGKKVRKRTLANLSHLAIEQIEAIRLALRGEKMVPAADLFNATSSLHHGHVQAVLETMRRLDFANLLNMRPGRQRDVAMAAVAARVLQPNSKLATTRWWRNTTLPELFDVANADEDEIYAAMDWLLEHQPTIEKKLAARHLKEGSLILFDLTSSYFEGKCCPLAELGHNRDKKKGKLQVNHGLLADPRGCPVAVAVFAGNINDPKTLIPQVQKARSQFGLQKLVMVGDRGMISQKQINTLKGMEGVAWITALRSKAIEGLIADGTLQLGLFDERNLFEMIHPRYPGERLVACRNPELQKLRAAKRQDLLRATVKELELVRGMVERGTLRGEGKIGVRVGKVINKYKVAKHILLDIQKERLEWRVDEEQVAAEALLDGIYVIRTSLSKAQMDAADTVRSYKDLSRIERAFRSLKSIDLLVRPIRHWTPERVRAHIFLCMLAYYVQWHMIEAWRPLLFADEDQAAKATRDPVAPANRSRAALEKVHSKVLDDGTEAHSFRTLLEQLSTIVRNTCQRKNAADREPTFQMDTTPNPKQQRALDLIGEIKL